MKKMTYLAVLAATVALLTGCVGPRGPGWPGPRPFANITIALPAPAVVIAPGPRRP